MDRGRKGAGNERGKSGIRVFSSSHRKLSERRMGGEVEEAATAKLKYIRHVRSSPLLVL